jgi:hypothetical protein
MCEPPPNRGRRPALDAKSKIVEYLADIQNPCYNNPWRQAKLGVGPILAGQQNGGCLQPEWWRGKFLFFSLVTL